MAYSADLAVPPFFKRPDLRWFLMAKIGRSHVVGGLTPLKNFFTFLTLPPVAFHPVIILVNGIVRYGTLFFLLGFFWTVILYRIYGLKGTREIFVLVVFAWGWLCPCAGRDRRTEERY